MKKILLFSFMINSYLLYADCTKGVYFDESKMYRLDLYEDCTYRLIYIAGENKQGKVYDKIGYWEEKRGEIVLYFTGYDIKHKIEIEYQGCSKIEKKPITEYTYKKRGKRLKATNDKSKIETFVLSTD